MDRFPEAFSRYEEKVEVSDKWTFQKLLTSFREWGKDKWKDSRPQKRALAVEAEVRGIKPKEEIEITYDEKIISYINKYGKEISYLREARTQKLMRNVLTGKFEKIDE